MTKVPLKPSRLLGKAGSNLWSHVNDEYELADSGSRELLLLACQALDRAEDLRAEIDKQGMIVKTKEGNIRDHPALRHELANRSFVAKCLDRLGLALETPARGVGRPVQGGIGITAEHRIRHNNGREAHD